MILQAVRLVEFLIHKGSFGIGSFYLSLMDSSEEPDSPPSHYQLLSEVKAAGRILSPPPIQDSASPHCSFVGGRGCHTTTFYVSRRQLAV